jgi:2-succinyl-6-hydroxy-2,4-cyclohexadiene-1-carboxylate synthase
MRILALHGFLGDPADWRAFAAAVRSHRPDGVFEAPRLPGHGSGSDLEAPPPAFDGWTDWLLQRIAAQPEPCHLLGYSLGGRLALAAALDPRARGRVRSLALLSASPGLSGDDARAARRALDEQRALRLQEAGLPAFLREWYAQPLFTPLLESRGLDALLERRCGGEASALAEVLRAVSPGRMPHWRPRLGGLEVPLLALAGSRDEPYAGAAREQAALAPRGRAVVLPGAGHALLLEAPGPAASAWLAWIDEMDHEQEDSLP